MANVTCLRLQMLHTSNANYNFHVLHFTYAALSVASSTINMVALIVFYKIGYFKTLHKRFLVILTTSDLLASVTVEPLISYDFFLLSDGINDCRVSNLTRFIGFNIFFVSVTVIALINIEQFFSISTPFRSCNICSFTHIMIAMATIWGISVTISYVCIYVYPSHLYLKYKTGMVAMTLLVYCCMCLSQMKVNKSTRQIVSNHDNQPRSQQIENVKLCVRVTKMTTSIILVFGMCYVPSILVSIYERVRPSQVEFSSTYIRTWCYFISYLNPLLDPLVYCFRLKSFRNYLFRSLTRPSSVNEASQMP